jgi:hypothetical protein
LLCIALKYPLIAILFTAIFAQTLYKSLQWAEYLLNVEMYQKKCINKNRPSLNCNGQCALAARWKSQKNNNSEESIPKLNTQEYLLFNEAHVEIEFRALVSGLSVLFRFKEHITKNNLVKIFHPPEKSNYAGHYFQYLTVPIQA